MRCNRITGHYYAPTLLYFCFVNDFYSRHKGVGHIQKGAAEPERVCKYSH